MRSLPALACLAMLTMPASAQSAAEDQPNSLTTIQRSEAPKAVLDAIKCDAVLDYVTRERFAGGWLWESKCPSNHANEVAAQIFSRDKDGKNAALIRFPTPQRGKALEELSNVEVFPANHEFNALFVDPEDKKICRTEARWIAKNPLKPELVFWRETRDCDGKKGWRVIVDKKK